MKCLLLIWLVAILTSCAKTDSSNVKTSGFYASYSVAGNNQNSVTCRAEFRVGSGGTFISLDSGDSVTCNGNSMARSEIAGMVEYTANVTYSPGSTYTLTLTRSGESPYSSTVILPAPILGYSPTSVSQRKGTAITPTWLSSGSSADSMSVTLSYSDSGSSFSENFVEVDTSPEEGSVGFSSSETSRSPASTGTWAGTLTFLRYRYGSVALGLDGIIRASQSVSVPVSLTD